MYMDVMLAESLHEYGYYANELHIPTLNIAPAAVLPVEITGVRAYLCYLFTSSSASFTTFNNYVGSILLLCGVDGLCRRFHLARSFASSPDNSHPGKSCHDAIQSASVFLSISP